MKAAFQGVRGAYSEEAALRFFGKKCEPAGHAFSEEVFDAVESGRADFGIIPVENSIAGAVGVNTDLLLERRVSIIAEVYLRIDHCLLSQPGAALTDIKAVYSHPVALAQCRVFLRRNRWKAVPEHDTAGSAALVSKRGLKTEAAIASSRCAGVYGLKMLRQNVQSVLNNITRFVIFIPGTRAPRGLKMEKTSLAFAARHKPGALLKCLECFANWRINLTRLESRPIPDDPFKYVFFIDCIGGAGDPTIQSALKELKTHAAKIKLLGSYPIAKSVFPYPPNPGRHPSRKPRI